MKKEDFVRDMCEKCGLTQKDARNVSALLRKS